MVFEEAASPEPLASFLVFNYWKSFVVSAVCTVTQAAAMLFCHHYTFIRHHLPLPGFRGLAKANAETVFVLS